MSHQIPQSNKSDGKSNAQSCCLTCFLYVGGLYSFCFIAFVALSFWAEKVWFAPEPHTPRHELVRRCIEYNGEFERLRKMLKADAQKAKSIDIRDGWDDSDPPLSEKRLDEYKYLMKLLKLVRARCDQETYLTLTANRYGGFFTGEAESEVGYVYHEHATPLDMFHPLWITGNWFFYCEGDPEEFNRAEAALRSFNADTIESETQEEKTRMWKHCLTIGQR